jgi:hypothetical protein
MNNEVDELNNTIFNRLEIKSLKAHPKFNCRPVGADN